MITVKLASFLGENTDLYLLAAFLILLGVGYALFYAKARKKSRAEDERMLAELEDDSEIELCETHVRVAEKLCGTRAYGTNDPHFEKGFFIVFETDDGERTEYRVDEETYLSVEDDMMGTVATYDGRFYGFVPDEK